MTIYISQIKRLRIYEEPNGSFATEGSIGSFKECPFIEGTCTLKLNQPSEPAGHYEQHIDGYPLEIFLPRSAELDFDINMETLDTRPSGTAVQGALGLLLKVCMGGEALGTGSTITSGASATSIPLTSASGCAVGTALGFATGSGGALEAREIKSKSSNTCALKLALSGSPANGSTVYSSATYYLDGTDGSETTSLQCALEGQFTSDRWLLLGGQLKSMTITLGPGTIPRIKFAWQFVQWQLADGSNTTMNLTSSALAIASYTNVRPIVQKDSEFRSQTNGTTTLASTMLDAPAIEYKPNISYTMHRTPAGVQTVKQWLRQRAAPTLSGSFSIPYEATTWFTARDNRTAKAFFYQMGSAFTNTGDRGGCILLSAPTTQVTDVQLTGVANITSTQVSWKARLDEDTSEGSATDLGKSAFRIHIM